jgi:hypothetical protein
MARTYRKSSLSRWKYFWDEDDIREWERTSARRDGQSLRYWTEDVKRETRRDRRRDWKRSEHEILKSADYEEVDVPRLEKKYLGEIWNWD